MAVTVKLFSNPQTFEADIAAWVVSLGAPQNLSFSPVGTRATIVAIAQSTDDHAPAKAYLDAAALLAAQTAAAATVQADALLVAATLQAQGGAPQLSPPAATVIDANGDVWVIGDDNLVLRNTVRPNNDGAGDSTASLIMVTHNHFYILGFNDAHWYKWSGTGYIDVGLVQPGT